MKKMIVLLLILTVALAGAFAELIQVGPTGRFQGRMTEVEDWKDVGSYKFGVDARVNLAFLSVSGNALLGFDDNSMRPNQFDTDAALSYRMDLGLVDLELGAGARLNFVKGEDSWTVNGKEMKDFAEAINPDLIVVRAAVGLNLGGIGVSADYKIAPATIVDVIKGKDDVEAFKNGSISVSALINLF